MSERKKTGHGGRPRSGREDAFTIRVTIELGRRVGEGAEALGTSLTKYLEMVMARAHDYSPPEKLGRLEAFERTASADPQREHLGHVTPVDRRAVVDWLHACLTRSGLDVTTFGPALGVAEPVMEAFLSGFLSTPGQLLFAADRISSGLSAAREQQMLAPVFLTRDELDPLPDDRAALSAFKRCRDDLRRALATDDPVILAAWEASPTTTGRIELDALFAAMMRHEFDVSALPPPVWTSRPDLELGRPWHLKTPGLTLRELEARTPDWLCEAKLFVAATDLGSKSPPPQGGTAGLRGSGVK